jgi:hypothetical protein
VSEAEQRTPVTRVSYRLDGKELHTEPVSIRGVQRVRGTIFIDGALYDAGWANVMGDEPDVLQMELTLICPAPAKKLQPTDY